MATDDTPAPVRTDAAADRWVAGQLAYEALVEIRSLAGTARREPESLSPDEALDRIRFLAGLAHNLPLVARQRDRWRPSRPGASSRRDRAMRARPMSWTWETGGQPGQEWMLSRLARAGLPWTPPPPLPTARRDHGEWTLRQPLRVLAGWPVRTPPGRRPLPRPARKLKALDRDGVVALYEERDRRGRGKPTATARLRAHLDPHATHYVFPDPAGYAWPDDEHAPWECTLLLRMVDGERITSSVAVLPETFTALPSTVPRIRQRRLALAARMLERDHHLWYRDHQPDCIPQRCGYPAEPAG